MSANDMSEMQQIELVLKDAKKIADIANPSEIVQMVAVSRRPCAISSIKSPSVNVIKVVLDKDPFGLEYLLKNNESLITEELVKYAASRDGNVIKHLPTKYITDDVRMIAVKNKPKLLAGMLVERKLKADDEFSLKLVLCGLEYEPAILAFLPPDIKAALPQEALLRAIVQDSSVIRYIDAPDATMQKVVVADNSRNILHLASDVVIPELQEIYQAELIKRDKAKEKSLKSPSNTILRRRNLGKVA